MNSRLAAFIMGIIGLCIAVVTIWVISTMGMQIISFDQDPGIGCTSNFYDDHPYLGFKIGMIFFINFVVCVLVYKFFIKSIGGNKNESEEIKD